MIPKFQKPNFTSGQVELRYDKDKTICIYGTKAGLEKLSDFCLQLSNNPETGHIHLEDYQLLTKNSLIGAIAIFDKQSDS